VPFDSRFSGRTENIVRGSELPTPFDVLGEKCIIVRFGLLSLLSSHVASTLCLRFVFSVNILVKNINRVILYGLLCMMWVWDDESLRALLVAFLQGLGLCLDWLLHRCLRPARLIIFICCRRFPQPA